MNNYKRHYLKAEEYWKSLLKDYISLGRVANDFVKINDDDKFNMIQKTIKKSMYNELLSYCDRNNVYLESVLDTVFGIVIQRFTYEDDIVFGKNSTLMPIRIKTKKQDEKFIDLCRSTQNQVSKSKEYDYYMISQSGYKNALNDKLINIGFVIKILCDSPISRDRLNKLDMYMKLSVSDDIKIQLLYKSSLYSKKTARSMVYLFKYILQQILLDDEIKLNEIQNMKLEHRLKFKEVFKSNLFEYDKDVDYVSLLKKQVNKTPDNIAISDVNSDMTYLEMDVLTDKIAGYLNHIGIKEGDTVAVLQERNKYVVLSAIAIIKAGAIFFPIDRTNPNERLGYLLEDGEAKLILSCQSMSKRLQNGFSQYNTLMIDDPMIENTNYPITGRIDHKAEAYRISTSGTTGRPKCISIRHESLMNMCYYSIDYINATEKDRCGIYLSFSFDAIMKQIFPYLLVGACVDVIPESHRKTEYSIEKYCLDKGITILALPAILGKLFIDNCPCDSLRVLQVGGDKFKGYVDRKYEIYNEYGPAEFTVLCTKFKVEHKYEIVPVGTPIYNTETYILDKNNNLCAVGVPGELCLSGVNIANGYLNRPNQNKEVFVKNPFAHSDDTKMMYRTGDLAKWIDEKGNIEIIGRMDSQVQINGIRIEIFEIENMINMIPDIKTSVVVCRENEIGESYLDAYYVPYEEYYPQESVRLFLEKNLPPHMIPKHIVQICVMPVTPIGKTDKKALPIILD